MNDTRSLEKHKTREESLIEVASTLTSKVFSLTYLSCITYLPAGVEDYLIAINLWFSSCQSFVHLIIRVCIPTIYLFFNREEISVLLLLQNNHIRIINVKAFMFLTLYILGR